MEKVIRAKAEGFAPFPRQANSLLLLADFRLLSIMSVKARVFATICLTSAAALIFASPVSAGGQQAAPKVSGTRNVPVGSARVVVDIKGMYCSSCEQTIRAMLMRTPGVRSASVSSETGQAVVFYDPARTRPSAIVATISRLGYTARLQTQKS